MRIADKNIRQAQIGAGKNLSRNGSFKACTHIIPPDQSFILYLQITAAIVAQITVHCNEFRSAGVF
jgi:hypothetical protein